MNQQPDKLFREKLEGYQRPAPASAWEKIALAQSKKNDKWLWLKIAASISVVAAAGYLLLPADQTTELSQDTSTKLPEEKKPAQANQAVVESTEDIKTETTKPSRQSNNTSTLVAKRSNKIETITSSEDKDQQLAAIEEVTQEKESLESTTELNESIAAVETIIEPDTKGSTTTPEVEPQNITLVYTAEDVEEYLDKKSLAEATSEGKKSSTLKKLLKKANDLTNNQDPFGELRQKKNEILALNFKSEKQRGQNK